MDRASTPPNIYFDIKLDESLALSGSREGGGELTGCAHLKKSDQDEKAVLIK